MEMVVNSIGNTLNRNSTQADANYLSSDAGGGGSRMGAPKNASDISAAILDIFKCSLAEADSYLGTFETRLKLEEDYVRGLRTLLEKSKDSLVKLDSRIASCMYIEPGGAELPRARQAWKSMRENNMRELDARETYIQTLRHGVIAPLISYRDSQERIRKRVKEDLKTSIDRYEEMRHHTLPRAKKTYEKRCDDVEQMRMQQQAIEDQRSLLGTPTFGMTREPSNPGSSRDVASPTLSSPVSDAEDDRNADYHQSPSGAESPRRSQSTRAASGGHHRNESGGMSDKSAKGASSAASSGQSPRLSGDGTLSLSPPSSDKKGHFLDALRSRENWEAARKEAPKKLNALISRMREGGGAERDVGGSLGSPNGEIGNSAALGLTQGSGSIRSTQNIALKSVKAKRDAEEADQVYRKVIFDLETLRLRREKTVSAAVASVLESRRELYVTCQSAWMQSERSSQFLTGSQLKLSENNMLVLQGSLEMLEKELARVESRVPALAEIEEGRVPYVNYHYGECKDLLFGVSLIDYAFNRAQHTAPTLGPGKVEAPLIVRKCISYIEERALTQSGIYRISAKHTAIQNLAHSLEKDEERFEFNPAQDEPATVSGVLKLYLRQLPEAVMPIPWEERIRYTHERQEQIQSGFAALKSRIRRLPAINQATLKTIVEHLAKVASYSEQNKMNVQNLSIVFGPLLLSQADHETTSIAAAMEEDRVTEDLILYCHDIFDLSHAGAPVLPPLKSSTAPGKSDLSLDKNYEQSVAGASAARDSLAPAPLPAPERTDSFDSTKALVPQDRRTSLKRSNAIVPSLNPASPDSKAATAGDGSNLSAAAAAAEPYSTPSKTEAAANSKRETSVLPLRQTHASLLEQETSTNVIPASAAGGQEAVRPHLIIPKQEQGGQSNSLSHADASVMYQQ